MNIDCEKADCYFYDHPSCGVPKCKFDNHSLINSDCSGCPYYITRNHARIVVVNYVKDRKGE
jgi:hypothetical protein